MLLLQPIIGWSQDEGAVKPESPPVWTVPRIDSLPLDWWTNFITEDSEALANRAELLSASISEHISTLDADNLVSAQTSVNALKTNIDAVLSLQNAPASAQEEVLPTLNSYSLEQFFDLQKLARQGDKQLSILDLEQQKLTQQIRLLEQKRDLNLTQYKSSDPSSPARLLSGLNMINIQLELYSIRIKLNINTVKQAGLNSHLDDITQRIEYASNHLSTDKLNLGELDSSILGLNDDVTKTRRKQAAIQQELLDTTNTDNPDSYKILNLKQRLTLVSAEELLAQLKIELKYTKRDWLLLRTGTATSTQDLHKRDPLLKALLTGAPQQTALWTDASQNTLITTAPESGRTARKRYDNAQSDAHKTLSQITDINAVMDNLSLVQNQVASESLKLEQGLSGVWLRFSIFSQNLWDKIEELVNISLFHINEHPVTSGSFVKALIVFLFFWALSWLIRHFLNRLEERQRFQQGSFYAGGRVVHYIILSIAVIAALGTIGLDFGSFALIAGALSVGIGFGLQSIVLNFVSGLILLFEGSIRVGDYVQMESGDSGPNLLGVVKEIRSRATMINTNDNIDVIVPNAQLVGNRMINFTLRDSTARMRIPFVVAFGSDKELVQKAALEAADEGEFCIRNTPGRNASIRMIGFGDSALNFELRVWVNRQGVRRPTFVASSILWAMDTKFSHYGVKVPFPQRDLHFQSKNISIDLPEAEAAD